MTVFRDYLTSRVLQLAADGQAREGSISAMAEATGIPAGDVEAFFAGDVDVDDLELCRKMGAALDLDDTEVVEQATEGTLVESYAELDDGSREALGMRRGTAEATLGVNDFVYATGRVARDYDAIDIPTLRTGQFSKNPVVLNNHNPYKPVVGRSSRPKRALEADELLGTVTWDMGEDNEDGRRFARQYHEGFLTAVSIRWSTGKYVRFNELPTNDPRYRDKPVKVHSRWGVYERMGGVHFNGQLIEVSGVSIPGDTGAVKRRGLGVEAGQTLRALDWQDPEAAAALRSGLLELLKGPEVWEDQAIRDQLGSAFRHLVVHDRQVRNLLKAAGLTTPNIPRSSEEDTAARLFDFAARTLES